MSTLKGKTAIVTGASKGIGAGIARTLAEKGAAVTVNYSTDKAGAERVVKDIVAKGGKAIAVQGSVAKAADVQRLFAVSKEAFGGLDILVNNAGVFAFAPIDDFDETEYRRQYDTNVLGILLATQAAVKDFGQKGGSVINVSSVVSEKGIPGAAVYSGTKGAVDALSRALAIELAPKNIRVNVVAPGGVETEGTISAGIIGGEMEKQMAAQTPLGNRLAKPGDIAKVVGFLASDDSSWLTGERISASGGFR
jgi:3-oxoacyl-[acyl-carrier protein] reductase